MAMMISSFRCILLCAIAIGCSSPEVQKRSERIVGACDMAATDRLLALTHRLSFDTRTATVAFDGPGALAGTASSTECYRSPQGYVATMTGTGTWDGAPDHRFALHAVHIPAEIASSGGWVIDSASLHIASPTGELVHAVGGFVDAPFDTVAASFIPQECAASGSATLVSRDRVTFSAVNAGGIGSGTLEVVGTPGGGPRRRVEAQIGVATCRNDGIRIADLRGFGTLDGVGGYTVVAQVEDGDGSRLDHIIVVAYDQAGREVYSVSADAPPDSFAVVF